MGPIHIVTDSTCNIPEALRRELKIHVVQLPYVWDGETYLDEVSMGLREFYDKLRQSKTIPTTSGPVPGSYRSTFDELLLMGGSILVMHVGQEFSSTYKMARMAKEMLPEANIHLVDSHSNGLGLGFQVLAVARAARAGYELDELIGLAKKAREHTGIIFAVGDVEYLHHGGRIDFSQRFFASMLNLIPVMMIDRGPIKVIGQARSPNKAMMKIVDLVEERVQGLHPVRIGVHHSDNEQGAFALRKIVQERLQPDELIMAELSPSLGIHIGPDGLGLAFCAGI